MESHLLNNLAYLPDALLLLIPEHIQAFDFVYQQMNAYLCTSQAKPCHTCQSCHFIQQKTHPDIQEITPEKTGSAIKVDQIRALQQEVYQTPLLSASKLVMIHPANELNRAAANALLKILEEPPAHVHFILIASHVDTLPATILSRVQVHTITPPAPKLQKSLPGYLNLGLYYEPTTTRGELFSQYPDILNTLSKLQKTQLSISQTAQAWSKHTLSDWLWLLHLLTTTLLQQQLAPNSIQAEHGQLLELAHAYTPVQLFKQLDMILKFTQQLNQDIPLNSTLVLETLLIGYACE